MSSKPHEEPVWFDKKCRKLVAKERQLYNKWKEKKSDTTSEALYKSKRREAKKHFNKAKRTYVESRSHCSIQMVTSLMTLLYAPQS